MDQRALSAVAHDWRAALLAEVSFVEPDGPARNRLGWPGYEADVAVRRGTGVVAGVDVVAVVWDFRVYGGSLGERDADAFVAAAADAAARRRPLVTFLRSGGTRLQEGVAGLVGLPRITVALRALAATGTPHLAVVDHPTTGGVWVTAGSRADLRVAVAGATVGFAGPRVVEAITGEPVPPGSHTAEAAYAAGLVDAVVEPDLVAGWLTTALRVLDVGLGQVDAELAPATPAAPEHPAAPDRGGWQQVTAARHGSRPAPAELLGSLLVDGVDLIGRDRSVRARLGLLPTPAHATPAHATAAHATAAHATAAHATAVVGVAVAARRASAPGPDGYRLLTRAARLAGRLGLPLVTLVDTPGADPSPTAEAAGIAAAIGEAMDAVLVCPSPTVAVVVGEGGSGGALAAACADVLLVTTDGYVAALSPEGTAATLRTSPSKTADASGLRPVDLMRLGIVDGVVTGGTATDLVRTVAVAVGKLSVRDRTDRLACRHAKWSTAATGGL